MMESPESSVVYVDPRTTPYQTLSTSRALDTPRNGSSKLSSQPLPQFGLAPSLDPRDGPHVWDLVFELRENQDAYAENPEDKGFTIYDVPTSLIYSLDETCLVASSGNRKPGRRSAIICCLVYGLSHWSSQLRQLINLGELLNRLSISDGKRNPRKYYLSQVARDNFHRFSFNPVDSQAASTIRRLSVQLPKRIKQAIESVSERIGMTASSFAKVCLMQALLDSQRNLEHSLDLQPWLAPERIEDLEASLTVFSTVVECRIEDFCMLATKLENS